MTPVAASLTDRAAAADAVRVAEAVAAANAAVLRTLRSDLRRAATSATDRSYDRGLYEALLAVVDAARRSERGLAPQSSPLEPGSLAARMLLEMAAGVLGANADLADRLDTDQWQVSRAGRKLRELGLATRVREGRLNGWTLSASGRREADRLRRPSRTA